MRKHHKMTHIDEWVGVREEIVIQTDCCFMKTRLVGVDDSFGRKGAFARSLGLPRLVMQSDGEHSIVELVRQTCDELPRARQQVTPMASKGSKAGWSKQTKRLKACSVWQPGTMWKYRRVTSCAVGAAWLLERFQPGEDGSDGYY